MLSNYYFFRLYEFKKRKEMPFPFLFSTLNTALFIAAVLSPLAEILVYLLFDKQFNWLHYYFLIVCCFVFPFYNKQREKIVMRYQNSCFNKLSINVIKLLYGIIIIGFVFICIFVKNEIHWYFERGELFDYFTN